MIAFSSDHHFHPYTQFAQTVAGLSSRLAEMLAVEDALDSALTHTKDCRVHIRCGDLFDKKHTLDAVMASEVACRLAERNREDVILRGNHDVALGDRSTLEFLEIARAKVVDVRSGPTVWEDDDAYVSLIPYHDEGDWVAKSVAATVRPTDKRMRILVAHCAVEGAKTSSEYPLPYEVTLAELQPALWDLVVLGHVHEPQNLLPNVLYVGSFCQRSFADEGSGRSWLSVNPGDRTWERVPLPGPRFHTVVLRNASDLESTDPRQLSVADYYRVQCPGHLLDAARERYEGPRVTVQAVVDPVTEATAPRLSREGQSWNDLVSAYVKQRAPGDLDSEQLKTIGWEIISDGSGV